VKKFFTIIFLLQLSGVFCQSTHIDTLTLFAGRGFENGRKSILKFPIIKTGNGKTDTRINTDIKDRITNNEFQGLDIDSALLIWSEEAITYMSFEVTYVKNELVSLDIRMEGCGANCSNWTDYFTYSTITGKRMTIEEIIDTNSNFKTRILADKNKQYNEQKKNLKKLFLDKNSGLDEESYTYLLEDYTSCQSSNAIDIFALHPTYLEIINTCYLPNVVKEMTPIIELKYKYSDIKKYLKRKL
jgi:hypothetical protein